MNGLKQEAFNEFCTLACSTLLFLFSDYVDNPELKYQVGYVFIGIYVVNFTANLFIILKEGWSDCYKKIRRIYYRLKFKKLM